MLPKNWSLAPKRRQKIMTKSSNFVVKRRKWLHWKDSKWVKRRNARKGKTFGAAWKLLTVNSARFPWWLCWWSPFCFKVQVRLLHNSPFYSFTPNSKPLTAFKSWITLWRSHLMAKCQRLQGFASFTALLRPMFITKTFGWSVYMTRKISICWKLERFLNIIIW